MSELTPTAEAGAAPLMVKRENRIGDVVRCIAVASVSIAVGLLSGACSGPAAAPGPPSAYLGTIVNNPLPAGIGNLHLTDDAGRTMSLAALHGQIVVLADFLTLCQETCPLTTGNLLDMDRAVTTAGLASQVRFVELTVDPTRDTPSRLAAYRALVAAPPNWLLLTGNTGTVNSIWRYFRVWYQKVQEGTPAGVDWLTGRPLSYDVSHEDALIYLDPASRERFVVVGSRTPPGPRCRPPCGRF